ncbi:hypothetical protein [Clostridium butyricum]|uniref:hypothetical protein n=1 Tax=Clostridium butyricum TaxID=1492 RepID=UPI00129B47E9|nr:hypothetical protein [Clostridium butyricum]QGH20885.1 hypothetical protein EBL75_04435 [Clostridium butyricum]QGH24926.1 hypothetical protein EBQ27_04435 [Clostridium butyricum]
MNKQELINVMIESEFHHIQEHHENDDLKNNKEYQEDQDKSIELYEKLAKGLYKDQIDILLEYESTTVDVSVDLARYYFRKGIETAFDELKCLKEMEVIF